MQKISIDQVDSQKQHIIIVAAASLFESTLVNPKWMPWLTVHLQHKLGEFECDILASQLFVHSAERIQLKERTVIVESMRKQNKAFNSNDILRNPRCEVQLTRIITHMALHAPNKFNLTGIHISSG